SFENSTQTTKMSNSGDQEPRPHIALLPSAGTGHLNPFLRLSAKLAARGCHVTVITPIPTFTAAESEHMDEFFSTYPNISRLKFQIVDDEPPSEFDQPIF
ncbi:hypothetical protein, partial [Salmonella sp. s58078]|uniref:hypothetical protein n=1 Tax=Salmonella sp. s58078 TaxID=3159699 RepID=UPI00397FCD0F